MSEHDNLRQEITFLADAVYEGTLSEKGVERLEKLAANDPELFEHFLDQVEFHGALGLCFAALDDPESTPPNNKSEKDDIDKKISTTIAINAQGITEFEPFDSAKDPLDLMVGQFDLDQCNTLPKATPQGSSGILGFLGNLIGFGNNESDGNGGGFGASLRSMSFGAAVSALVIIPLLLLIFAVPNSPVQEMPRFVKMGRQTPDTKWSGTLIAPPGCVLLPGQRLRLETGLVELDYKIGVKVLIEGPASFLITGENSGYLESGSAVAVVSAEEAHGFTISTTNADCVDLGTEFGVRVDEENSTKTKVLQGKIQVQLETDQGVQKVKRLLANEAIQVDSKGNIKTIDPDSVAFINAYPESEKLLNLVDLLCGGNGTSYRRGLWIDPTNGAIHTPDSGVWRPEGIPDSPGYNAVPSLSAIDGVFLPFAGESTQITSQGHQFDGLGHKQTGTTSCLIAGAPYPPSASGGQANWAKIGKTDYTGEGHTSLTMHTTQGITIDLEPVRNFHPGYQLVQFQTNLGSSKQSSPSTVIDVFVLADGEPIYIKQKIVTANGELPLCVNLPEGTRFLTLIAADHGEAQKSGNNQNHILVFGDPKLALKAQSR